MQLGDWEEAAQGLVVLCKMAIRGVLAGKLEDSLSLLNTNWTKTKCEGTHLVK